MSIPHHLTSDTSFALCTICICVYSNLIKSFTFYRNCLNVLNTHLLKKAYAFGSHKPHIHFSIRNNTNNDKTLQNILMSLGNNNSNFIVWFRDILIGDEAATDACSGFLSFVE